MDVMGPHSVYRYHSGAEQVHFAVNASNVLPEILDQFGYERVLIYASRTLNRKTSVVSAIAEAIGPRLVGVSDAVGEHAPISNIVKGIHHVHETNADAMIGIGGGSVFDFGKFVQLGVWAGANSREELLAYQSDRGNKNWNTQPPESMGTHRFRQIAVPTTFSAAEASAGGTPVDDETGAKVRFVVRHGAPRAVIYDPEVIPYTPTRLLMASGIRGLDHALNTVMSTEPNIVCSTVALSAIPRYFEHLPKIFADRFDLRANAECQLATWLTGMGQSVPRGFSFASVHVLAPWAMVGHGEAACVMMLAQARWFSEVSNPALDAIADAVGRPGMRVDHLVQELLERLKMPTSLADLGVARSRLPELAELVHAHPVVHQFNLRPIVTLDDVTAVLSGVLE